MWQERIQRYLLPGDIEHDERFREGIRRLSHIGLQVVGGVEIVLSAFMTLAQMMLDPNPELQTYRMITGTLMVLLGIVTLALGKIPHLYPHARSLAIASGVTAAAILTWMMLLMTQFDPTTDDFIPGNITLLMLVGVAAIPLRPADTLLFGFLLQSIYVISALAAQELLNIGTGVDKIFVLFIFMLTCLAAGLTAVLYDQRRSAYEWSMRSLEAANRLRQAEARDLLAQNAASVGRLAAALSHELNSPVGALVSGVDTLLLLASRQATGDPKDLQRLVVLQNDIRKSIKDSTERLREIVRRMQRFTNLDKAEVQEANVNDIISDVSALVQPLYKEKARTELDLGPVPAIVCRPQQLSAVFSNLLRNAFEATKGGTVRVCSRGVNGTVEVAIEDNGHGLDSEQILNIFDPEFKVAKGRVATGNWSMFSSRQIVREHGGDIRIESSKGNGTRVIVSLPTEGAPLT